jgi:hypothetical protein
MPADASCSGVRPACIGSSTPHKLTRQCGPVALCRLYSTCTWLLHRTKQHLRCMPWLADARLCLTTCPLVESAAAAEPALPDAARSASLLMGRAGPVDAPICLYVCRSWMVDCISSASAAAAAVMRGNSHCRRGSEPQAPGPAATRVHTTCSVHSDLSPGHRPSGTAPLQPATLLNSSTSGSSLNAALIVGGRQHACVPLRARPTRARETA